MNSVLTTLVSLSLWIIVFSMGALSAWGQTDERAKLVEGAKKEGKLVWYTSANVTESKPLLDDFEKQHPFVKGEIFRASGEKTLNRIMTETRAGSVGMFKVRDEVFGFGRLVRGEQFGVHQRVHFVDRDDVEVPPACAGLDHDSIERLFAAGAEDFTLDEGMLLLEIVQQRLGFGHVGRRVPN